MNIRKETAHLLVLEDRPWAFGQTLIFFAVILSWAGMSNFAHGAYTAASVLAGVVTGILIMMRLIIKRTVLVFDRDQGTLSIATRGYNGDAFVVHALDNLGKAVVQSAHRDDAMTHRVALRLIDGMDQGDHPVTRIYTRGDSAIIASHTINRWLTLPLDSATTSN